MKLSEIILLPFVFIYKGFITILLIPYYLVLGIVKIFELIFSKSKMNANSIPELKNNKNVKVIKGVRSAYDTPVIPKEPKLTEEEKKENLIKRQKEFEKLVKKAKEDEEKRIKEQERFRVEREKKEKERLNKEQERLRKEEAYEAAKQKRQDELKKSGQAVTLSQKINNFFKKMSKKEELELEVKKAVLDEQFKNKQNASSRFSKPLIFNYVAKNAKGEIEKSSIEALSRVDVHSFLLQEGYEVYDISIAKSQINIQISSGEMKRSRLIFYLSQLSAYLKSGISLAESVKIIQDQAKKIHEKKVWKAVYYDLSMGDVLSTALEKRRKSFPKLLINMIRTAEMTGDLIDTLDDMVDYYTEQESIKKQMRSAMVYPAVVSLFAILVITFILLWVVPEYGKIYDDLSAEKHPATVIVLAISAFLKEYIIFIAIALFLILLLYIYLFNNVRPFRKTMQEFMMHIPVFGNIIIYNEVTMFTKTFANLINHNVFITDSMDVLNKVTNNEIYKKLIHDAAKNLTKGETISKAFKDHWAFPNIAYQMLLTGEKTGRLGPMMERVSDYYQEQHRNIVNQMKSLLEPMLIIFLSVVVGIILLSVILPMFDIYSQIS